MSWLVERNDPYAAQPVSIAPISDEQQTDENLEPPFVRIRDGNESFIYADSEERDDLTSPNDYVLGGGRYQFQARKLKRIALDSLQIALCTPNINARNNTLIFFSTSSASLHSVTLQEGFWTTIPQGALVLQTALNSATGASGLTFTVNWIDPGVTPGASGQQINISAAGGAFLFPVIPPSTTMTRGRYLFNLPRLTAPVVQATAGAVYLMYSRYFDIVSQAFTEYTKNPNSSNARGPNALVRRVPLSSQALGVSLNGIPTDAISATAAASTVSTNYNRSRALEVLDLRIIDEFGEPFYMPSLSTGTPPNTGLVLGIKTEL
jgi:hypothetical protein